ncbi:MAG: hypothetical protein AB1938_06090 [Myxococcota bacterium]
MRGIPRSVDRALRERARREGKSLNEVTVEALTEALGVMSESRVWRDLSDIAGTWVKDPAVERALDEQRIIDTELWK